MNATTAAGPASTGSPIQEARPWLASYPPGVPHTIDLAKLGSLADLFRESLSAYAGRPAIESFGKRMTYAELGEASRAVASWLQAQGLRKGDRVAIMMPNVMAYPAVLFGVLIAGYTVVNVNPLYTARELAHQMQDAGARILFVLENFAHTVEEALPNIALERIVVVAPGDLLGLKGALVNLVSRRVKKAVKPYRLTVVPFKTVMAEGRRSAPQPVSVTPDDVAFLQYTGGTTGVAKGAVLLHRNVAANIEQSRLWFGERAAPPDGGAVMVTALPLYHIFALTCCFFFMMRVGGCCLLIANPRDIPGFVKTLAKSRFTMTSGVNTLYNALANHAGLRQVDFSRVTACIAGGMATQAAVAKRWKEVTGRPIIEGYGLSETSPVVCCNRADLSEFSGTIGFPLPSTDVSIRSAEGAVLPPGERGELCVKGPQVMAGYWKRPDETTKVMTSDGYFRTGDVAVLQPDGQVKIVDRMKDMIIVSGFNVYPNEVEEVLVGHPGILEAAVIGLPDDHSGEVVAAYIVPREPSLTVDEVRDFCRERLTGYKIPRRIEFRDNLPKTNVGKVLRRALRDEVLGAAS